jgi:uncharacterized iron-regulated membrane protein
MLAILYKWHLRLGVIAGTLMIVWAASGLIHPLLSFTGIKPMAFTPPVEAVVVEGAKAPSFLPVQNVTAVRVVSVDGKPFYQLTLQNQAERLYYRESTGELLPNADVARAESLARHYSGEKTATVVSTTLQTAFDKNYPPINKYLPVWRVAFDRPDGLSVYVDTGEDKLGSINTPYKQTLLWLFQNIHTLKFLESDAEAMRLGIITCAMLMILAMACLGIALLWTLKRPKMPKGGRGLHRRLAWLVWLPVLAFSGSGLFHLWVQSTATTRETVSVQPIDMAAIQSLPQGVSTANDIRLSNTPKGLLWRVEMALPSVPNAAPNPHAHHMGNTPKTKTAYFSVHNGEAVPFVDTDIAQAIAQNTTGTPTLLPMFSPEYGFANKRLPVWRVETPNGLVFVDAKAGVVAARVSPLDKIELWSFSNLHKGQFLDTLLGVSHTQRDGILAGVATLIIVMSGVGLWLHQRRRRSLKGTSKNPFIGMSG